MRIFSVTANDALCLVSSVQGMEKLMLELLTSGLRIYDLHALSWSDINFNSGEISVWDIKSIPTARIINASDYMIECLAELKSLSRHAHFVFCDVHGERYSLDSLKGLINRAMSIGGVIYTDIGHQDLLIVGEVFKRPGAESIVN